MRVHITGRDGYPITAIVNAISAASGITYETGLPGGMLMASCMMPWAYGKRHPRLLGAKLQVRDGIDCVWEGRIHDVTERVQGRSQYLELTAAGPWAWAAKQHFTSSYVSGGAWTGTDILKAAVYGHMEDVAQRLGGDVGPAYDVGALAWTDSSIQDVVAEVLRLGDDTTSSWSFVVWPPVYAPAGTGGYTFSSDCDALADFTGTHDATIETGLYHRGGSCLKLSAAAGHRSYAEWVVAAAATYCNACWVYVPKNALAEEYGIFYWYEGVAGFVVRVYIDASRIIKAYNYHTTTAYTATGSQTIGLGCWHHVATLVTRHATTGVIQVWLDGQLVINQSGLDTGDNNPTIAGFGAVGNSTGAISWYMDDCIVKTSALTMNDTVTAETLPEPRIINMSSTTHDFMLSLASVGGSAFTESLQSTANQVRATYGSSLYTDLSTDSDSVQAYGQLLQTPSITRTASATVAGYLRDRYLERWKEPAAMLQPITLTTAPTSRGGGIMPLSRIKAGMTFAIRERPDLGVFYVGGTRYAARGAGQGETCQITPIEPAYDLVTAVALRELRTRT